MRRAVVGLFAAAGALVAGSRQAAAQDTARPLEAPRPSPPPAPVLTKPPRVVKEVKPEYPTTALEQRAAGVVKMLVTIDADGNVTEVHVSEGAGFGLDEAAMTAMREFKFEPAEIDGKPAPIRIEYVIHFVLPEVTQPPVPSPTPTPAPPPAAEVRATIVRGRVREKGTREPIVSADVSIQRPGGDRAEVVATTDDHGFFLVVGEPGGKARIIVSDGDHDPCIRDVDLPAAGGAPADVSCYVARRAGGEYEATVRAKPEGEEVTRHTLSRGELTSVPGTFGDPLRVIQNLPGMARMPYGLGLLIVRGANPQDTGAYVDGVRVPLLYHFLGGPSVLTPTLIDKIDFYPGGFGVRYGRNMAGVVDVTTRSESLRQLHGSADINLIDSSAYVEGPLNSHGLSAGLAGRRSYIDLLLPAFIPQEEGSTTAVVAPVYYDYQARADQDLGKDGRRGHLSLFVFGANDKLTVITADPQRGKLDLGTEIGFHRVVGRYAVPLGEWTSRSMASWGIDLVHFSAGAVGGDAGNQAVVVREDLARPIGKTLKIATGVDAEAYFSSIEFRAPVPPEGRTYGATRPEIVKVERDVAIWGTAVFAEALWDATPHLRLAPGLRLDFWNLGEVQYGSYDPRIVVRVTQNDRRAFKAGAGIFHQNPQPQQVDNEFGNPHLPLLWSDQYHAGIEQRLTSLVTADATVYFMRRHELPVPTTASHTEPAGCDPLNDPGCRTVFERFLPDGVGRSYGLELLVKHEITRHFFGWISYTLARSEETAGSVFGGGGRGGGGGMNLVADDKSPASQRSYHPTTFDQTHNAIVVASYKAGAWELGARFRVVTGVPETPIVGASYDADYNQWQAQNGPTLSVRRQTFHQLDLRVERTWTKDTWSLGAYLDVQNVYNAENPEATIYDYRFQQSAPVRGLPIVPTLGVRGRF